MSYDNNLRGVLFKNKEKRDDRDAEYRGSITIDGKEYWLDCWINESGPNSKTPGQKYMALKAKPKLQSDRGSPPTGGRNDPRPRGGDAPF